MKKLIASLILSSLIQAPAFAQGTIVPTDTLPPVTIAVPGFHGEDPHSVTVSEEKLDVILSKLSMEAQREQLEGNQIRVIVVHLMMSYLASQSSIKETQWKGECLKELTQTEIKEAAEEVFSYAEDLVNRIETTLTDE